MEETAALLKKARKLVLVSHISPDGDTIGSTLALGRALQSLGKEVILNVDDDIPDVFQFLPGIGAWLKSGATVAEDIVQACRSAARTRRTMPAPAKVRKRPRAKSNQ
jgi:phosphoesterase RecJ-like protein